MAKSLDIKLDPTGGRVWVKMPDGSTALEFPTHAAKDKDGNAILARKPGSKKAPATSKKARK